MLWVRSARARLEIGLRDAIPHHMFVMPDRCYNRDRPGISLMPNTPRDLPQTLGALRQSNFSADRIAARGVKDELRDNLICKLQRRETLFPGIIGYEDSVIPQVVNAVLSRHNFILLGLRGQ